MADVDCLVIGAGVIGLAIARALALEGREVMILEAQDAFGTETSARNSEVIHAGIYYPSGSLKARACVRGKALLYSYLDERSIHHKRIGKYIVATDASQVDTLKSYLSQAHAYGVNDVEIISETALKEVEPNVHGLAALWSPSTGIVDTHGLMLSLLGDVEAAGGTLALRSPVTAIESLQEGTHLVHVDGEDKISLSANIVINAAGHGAPKLG